MRDVRLPAWFASAVLDRYHSGASHLFLLHGNVRDVHPFGAAYAPLAEGLGRLLGRRPFAVAYDPSAGLRFADAEREKQLRKAIGWKGAWPSDPGRALAILDALLRSESCPPRSVGIVLEYAHTLAPGDASG
jgi:hypothetical protein